MNNLSHRRERFSPDAERHYTKACYPVVHSRNHRTTQCAAQRYTIMKIEYVLLPFFRSFPLIRLGVKIFHKAHTRTHTAYLV